VLWGCAGLARLVLAFMVGFVWWEAWPALTQIGLRRFLVDPSWHPGEGDYLLLPMIMGTMLTTLGAIVCAVPLGLGVAVFCQWYAPAILANGVKLVLELLAGIPSVVYGLWGLVVLVPVINRITPPGSSLLAGIVILAVMILPTLALLTQASLTAVPQDYVHSALALGLRRWSVICRIVIPAAKSGIVAAILLATGRALGETMAVLMVCGNVVQLPASLFDPIRTLAAHIALEMAFALDLHRAALFVSGLVLAVMIAGLVGLGAWLSHAGYSR
ncbi:MAG: phosphate ABC transporter permease subunit PstC, partial [Nitrospirae bacterium]